MDRINNLRNSAVNQALAAGRLVGGDETDSSRRARSMKNEEERGDAD